MTKHRIFSILRTMFSAFAGVMIAYSISAWMGSCTVPDYPLTFSVIALGMFMISGVFAAESEAYLKHDILDSRSSVE